MLPFITVKEIIELRACGIAPVYFRKETENLHRSSVFELHFHSLRVHASNLAG